MSKRSCLKSNQPTPVPSPGPDGSKKSSSPCSRSKCVAFCPMGEKVWFADEWDRTPTEPVRNLSYQDMLELKAIQKSLPIAIQPADPLAQRAPSQRLPKVPVGLLPLLPSETTVSPPKPIIEPPIPTSSLSSCPKYSAPSSLFPRGFAMRQERPPSPPLHQPTPRHLSHLLPSPTTIHKPKPRPAFAFVPLLDTPQVPEPEECSPDPPTPSLTNASLESTPNPSPLSRPSSSPDTPSYIQLPPVDHPSYFPPFEDHHAHDPFPLMTFKRTNLAPIPSPALQPPSPLVLNPASLVLTTTTLTKEPEDQLRNAPPHRRRKKQVIVINDIEMELDEDEDEPPSPVVVVTTTTKPTVVNKLGSRFTFLPLAGTTTSSCSPPRPPTSPPIRCS